MRLFDHHITHSIAPTYACNVCEILFRPAHKFGECFRLFTIAHLRCLDCGKPFCDWHEQEHPHRNPRGQCLGFRADGLNTSPAILRQRITAGELEEVADDLRRLAGELMDARTASEMSRATLATWVNRLQRLSQRLARG